MTSAPDPPPPLVETQVLAIGRLMLLLIVAFMLIGYLFYQAHNDRQIARTAFEAADKKAQSVDQGFTKTTARVAELQAQLDATTQKLGLTQSELARARVLAQSIQENQQKSNSRLRKEISATQADTATKFGQVLSAINGTRIEVAAAKADLAATKSKLQSAVGDLGVQSGLIARNHEEVEELKRLGQRDIFEFALKKEKAPHHVGPIQVLLRKTDTKRYRYTIEVVADDKTIEKKDKTVGEPVQFYVRRDRAPYEIVVFDLNKDEANGYLSAPKPLAAGPSTGKSDTSGN